MNLRLTVINKKKQFKNLRPEWTELVGDSHDRSITQTWEWLYTWWCNYGAERDLAIIVAYDDGKLIGIAPFSRPKIQTKYFTLIGYNTLYFLGAGTTLNRNITSDYLNLIIKKGRETDFVNSLLQYIGMRADWEELILENISAESSIPNLLKLVAKRCGLYYEIREKIPSILIKLPDSWQGYLNSISSGLRYKISRGRKEFSKEGGLYHLVREENELSEAFKNLKHLHQARWRSQGQPGAFSFPKWEAFHRKILPLALKNGWLKLSFLVLNGRAVATNYNFVYDNKVHFYQAGIEVHKNKHIRLGLLLHSYCIEEAIKEGRTEYDFLKASRQGAGYKMMWGNCSRDLLEIRISKSSNKENAYRLLTRMCKLIRKAKHRLETKIVCNSR